VVGTLDGTVALVTGAGQGVGRGIALALAAEGAAVAVTGRTLAKVDAVAAEIHARGGTALALGCDVAHRDQVDATVARVAAELGGVDVLVNNAQSVTLGPLLTVAASDLETVWGTGFLGTLSCMQAAFPHLAASGRGCVVNLGSGSSLRADQKGYGLYAAVKEAVRSLTRTAAVEWGEHGIRVNAVVPLALSPGLERWATYRPEEFAAFAHTVPLGRVGDCEADIGRAVAFLASPAAGYVTGSTLMLDGGQSFLR